MITELTILILVLAWFAIFYLFWLAIGWAKKRKTGAYVFGALVQMLLPDPNIEKTIAVIEQQKVTKAQPSNKQSEK